MVGFISRLVAKEVSEVKISLFGKAMQRSLKIVCGNSWPMSNRVHNVSKNPHVRHREAISIQMERN